MQLWSVNTDLMLWIVLAVIYVISCTQHKKPISGHKDVTFDQFKFFSVYIDLIHPEDDFPWHLIG